MSCVNTGSALASDDERVEERMAGKSQTTTSARRVQLAERDIERADAVLTVIAPASWPSARVEAWLDWADGIPGRPVEDEPLNGGPARWAMSVVAAGKAGGRYAKPKEAAASTPRVWQLFP